MGKKEIIIIIVAIVIVAIVAGYVYWKNKNTPAVVPAAVRQEAVSAAQSAASATEAITENAAKGVLPSIGKATNPLTNKPVVNPAEVSNPFKSLKTNPFR